MCKIYQRIIKSKTRKFNISENDYMIPMLLKVKKILMCMQMVVYMQTCDVRHAQRKILA